MTESDRDRAYRVCAKALTSITQACAGLDIPFLAVIVTQSGGEVYSAYGSDAAELCKMAMDGLGTVPEGAAVN